MNQQATEAHASGHWDDDVLDRKGFAQFLSRSLVGQAASLRKSQRPGITVALDADWGTGKSFFVSRWATDLKAAGHPVVLFDAWENDIGDEAVIALMASIKTELEVWFDKLSTKKKIRQRAKETTQSAVKDLRKAVLPMTKVIASGLFKKATGTAFEEVIEALSESEIDFPKELGKDASNSFEAGLDMLFSQTLEHHKKRAIAIVSFKDAINSLIGLLEEEANATLPVFVFVDEVDRCRPDYAIRLLEEIKHIFGINKLCFVVSTNLTQLQESVRAIYGAGFDGHRYLKRFFDYQYTLPEPDNESFSSQLLTQDSTLHDRKVLHGLPAAPGTPSAERAIATIVTAFDLDLRSQKQVFQMATAVAAAVPSEKKIFLLWLYFLCALRHRAPLSFDQLRSATDRARFADICKGSMKHDPQIDYVSRQRPYENGSIHSTHLSDVLWAYFDWSNSDLVKLRERDINAYNYPSSNLLQVLEEAPHTYYASTKYPPSIGGYMEWVKYAGMVKQQSEGDLD